MKTNRRTKSNSVKPAPIQDSAKCDAPSVLEFLARLNDKTPREIAVALIPALADKPKLEAMAGLLFGGGIDLGVALPDWVKVASKRSWNALGLECFAVAMTENSAPDPAVIGKMAGLLELIQRPGNAPDSIKALWPYLQAYSRLIKQKSAEDPFERASKFFDAGADAKKTLARMEGLSQRARVFFAIALAWREIDKFKSAGELHRWFMREKIIVPGTDAAEIRRACRVIGLSFPGKPGRQRQLKSGAPQ